MASTRDQVEAYTFEARRQVVALLQGDDPAAIDPRRRLNRSLIAGTIISVLLLAGVGVAGFLNGGASTSVPENGAVVTSGTGGGRFVIINHVAHPALNLASAMLVGGKDIKTVSAGALDKLPRGLPVGSPQAPDALPSANRLLDGPWTACSTAPQATAARAQVDVSIGAPVSAPMGDGAGVVARLPDGSTWLIDGGMRYRVQPEASTLLGLDRVDPTPLRAELLDLVPEGPPLLLPSIAGSGSAPQRDLGFAAEVGDLVEVDLGADQPGRYLVVADGVVPVDAFAFALLAGTAPATLHVPARQVAAAAAKSSPPLPASWPHNALRVVGPVAGAPLCFSYVASAARTPGAWPMTMTMPGTVPGPAGARPVAPTSGSLPTDATSIALPPGAGLLVYATAAGGAHGVYALVTDSGLRFSVATTDAVTRLGYDPQLATPVPLPFLDLLPAGPALDPAAAAHEYGGAAPPSGR